MQRQIALLLSLMPLVTAPHALAVQVLGASTGTAHCSDPLEMAKSCHATFVGSRVCDSTDLNRATSIADLPAPNGSYVTLLFHLNIKAAAASSGVTIVDELGMVSGPDALLGATCGAYTQLVDGTTHYLIYTQNNVPLIDQVLCCSDQ